MKSNVDLTENRDFLNYNKEAFDIMHYGRFGVSPDLYYIEKDTGVIMQGNGEERRIKLLCSQFNIGDYCDCCGTPIKPYINDCLCPKCSKNFEDNKTELFKIFY